MLHRNGLSLVVAVLSCVVLAGPVAGQATESPEDFLMRYMEATKAAEWPVVAGLMHPEALEELKAMFAPIAEHDTAGEVLPELFGIADEAEFTATSADTIFARLMQRVVQFTEIGNILAGSSIEPVGHVDEAAAGLTHVVFRMKMDVEGISMTQLDVAALKQHEGEWRAVLSGDIQSFATAIRQQLTGET